MPARFKRPRRKKTQNNLPFLFGREAVLVNLLRTRLDGQTFPHPKRGNPSDFASFQLTVAWREVCRAHTNSRRHARGAPFAKTFFPIHSTKLQQDKRKSMMAMSHNSKNNRVHPGGASQPSFSSCCKSSRSSTPDLCLPAGWPGRPTTMPSATRCRCISRGGPFLPRRLQNDTHFSQKACTKTPFRT